MDKPSPGPADGDAQPSASTPGPLLAIPVRELKCFVFWLPPYVALPPWVRSVPRGPCSPLERSHRESEEESVVMKTAKVQLLIPYFYK